MCTVSYISKGKNQFILTSNRDENAARSPHNITRVEKNGVELLFPRDHGAGGSWIVVSNTNKVICILNGAYVKHPHQPPYRLSRGLMALDFFQMRDAKTFFDTFEFEGMESFTMVTYDDGDLWDVRWDGKKIHTTLLNPDGNYIWASATLYDEEAKEKRQKWFAEWQENRTDYSLESIYKFHRYTGEGDIWNDLVMNRLGFVQTVSITQVIKEEESIDMQYNDLLRDKQSISKLSVSSRQFK
jgi:uncharacterized protein with NRDE domain